MANIFLQKEPRDVETAIMLERAIIHDIGSAVAYTDGDDLFINTDDNLYKILPAYNHDMLKWLLWHERYHMELKHHTRYYAFLEEQTHEDENRFNNLTHNEVNIIMDILVHDSLSKMFPELIETARKNYAQMRNCNSLKYTFKTHTLEEMLKEYSNYKKDTPTEDKKEEDTSTETKDEEEKEDTPTEDKKGTPTEDKTEDKKEDTPTEDKTEDKKEEELHESIAEDEKAYHDSVDWSKLEEINTKEFIPKIEARAYKEHIESLKRKKIRIAHLTETLNGLVTGTRERTYTVPSRIQVGSGIIMKGRKPSKARLYLCFDASGSMGFELDTFKNIIKNSVPQALNTPCEWFTWTYGEGTFKDILEIQAESGFEDDGDRLIELCWKAEQKGYSPIGVTDGGGGIYWNHAHLKQLKRTILIGQKKYWLDKCKEINPCVQTLYIGEE